MCQKLFRWSRSQFVDPNNSFFDNLAILNGCRIEKEQPKTLIPLIDNTNFIASVFFADKTKLEHGCLYSTHHNDKCSFRGVVKCNSCNGTLLSRQDFKDLNFTFRLSGFEGIFYMLLEKGFKEYKYV